MIIDPIDHEWKQDGKCVICVPCNTRLYQGKLSPNVTKEKTATLIDDIKIVARQYLRELKQQ